LVTTAQYCACFTLRRFGLIIKPSKEKSNPFEKKGLERIRKRPKPNHKKQAQKQNQKTKMEDIIMSKVVEFLKENPVQYLATVGRDGKAKCRPFMFIGEMEGKLWFCTNNTKDVYKDMLANPEIEISTSSPSYAWIRLNGKAVFENNMAAKEMCMGNPIVKGQYQTADNPIFEVFYLNNAHGVIADFSGNPPYEF
jgi:uncharacterized pyridoxamine 5'-phosphate oxidase family protein